MELPYPADVHDVSEIPMSRTHQYRKVMKPLLERKRRARINKCLDELKDLMVYALQSEGESITKLEKADVLELTVKHLHKLKRQKMLKANPSLDVDRFRAGFTACANEVSRSLAAIPGMDVTTGSHLMSHLACQLKTMEDSKLAPLSVSTSASTTVKPVSITPSSASDGGYSSGRESVSPRINSPINFVKQEVEEKRKSQESVWRPF